MERGFESFKSEIAVPLPSGPTVPKPITKDLSISSDSFFDEYSIEAGEAISNIEVPLRSKPPVPNSLSKPKSLSASSVDLVKQPKHPGPSVHVIANVFLQVR